MQPPCFVATNIIHNLRKKTTLDRNTGKEAIGNIRIIGKTGEKPANTYIRMKQISNRQIEQQTIVYFFARSDGLWVFKLYSQLANALHPKHNTTIIH